MSVFVISLNSSPAKCTELPAPELAKLAWPGRLFRKSMNSATVLDGTVRGLTTSRFGNVASRVAASKLFTVS